MFASNDNTGIEFQFSFNNPFHVALSGDGFLQNYILNSFEYQYRKDILPKIDESRFDVLYSKKDSRPNFPINIMLSAYWFCSFYGISEGAFCDRVMTDIKLRYALGLEDVIGETPLCERTMQRFRDRCVSYEEETGRDLLHEAVVDISKIMKENMGIDGRNQRQDSMMIEAHIKKLSRLGLLYTCNQNMVKEFSKDDETIDEALLHYLKAGDRNEVSYHSDLSNGEKIVVVLKEARKILDLAGDKYTESQNYKNLTRVLREQCNVDEDGNYTLKEKGDPSLDASIMQSPVDPDATFRSKAGKQHRGYVADMVEEVGENGGIITDYSVEQNIHSDIDFEKESLEKAEVFPEDAPAKRVVDGAYYSDETAKMAGEKNINLEPTNLTGKDTQDIHADFVFSDDGREVMQCPEGNKPESTSYDETSGQCTVQFQAGTCANCKHKEECKAKCTKDSDKVRTSAKSKNRAEKQRSRGTEEFKENSHFRNGVESRPSLMRRYGRADELPVHGLNRIRFFFGNRIAGRNLRTYAVYCSQRDKCAQKQEAA